MSKLFIYNAIAEAPLEPEASMPDLFNYDDYFPYSILTRRPHTPVEADENFEYLNAVPEIIEAISHSSQRPPPYSGILNTPDQYIL